MQPSTLGFEFNTFPEYGSAGAPPVSCRQIVPVFHLRGFIAASKQGPYPLVCLDVLPRPGTRIRMLKNGRVDLCLEHAAHVALVKALNEADKDVKYGVPSHVPQKPKARKEYYDRLNAIRWAAKRGRY
jgi:hypothetical protein